MKKEKSQKKLLVILNKTMIIALIMLFNLSVFSQENNNNDEKKSKKNDEIKTLFGDDISHGGYIGFSMNYSQIKNNEAIALGGRLGWIIDHKLTIGIGGYGFVNDVYVDNVINDVGFNLVGGYGGLIIEPIIAPKFPVHISFPILLGVGGIAYVNEYYDYKDEDYNYYTEDSDAFLVIEPGVEIDINVVKYLRIALGATYRYASDLNLINTKDDILNGLTYGLTLKIGKF